MIGSMFIMQAGHIDAVRDIIQNDIYYTAGVVSLYTLVIFLAYKLMMMMVTNATVGPKRNW